MAQTTPLARPARWIGPLTGLVSAAGALAAAEVVGAAVSPRATPLIAVGSVVVDTVPAPVKDFAIRTFGTHDKSALLVGTAVLLAAFAAVVGALCLRDRWYGLAGVTLFGAVGIAAALTRPGATIGYALPSLSGALVAGAILLLLPRRVRPDAFGAVEPVGLPGAAPAAQARRRFLTAAFGTVAGSALLGLAGRYLGERHNVAAARAAVVLPEPASPAAALPSQADPGVPGLVPFVTGNADFYRVDTALSVPQVDPAGWRLRIHGRVAHPYTITFADLLAMPMIERYVTLACVSNEVGGGLIGNAAWLGVPVAALIERAGPLPGADQVVGRSVDGFTTGTPTEVLLDGRDAMLAVGMNGVPLPVAHGFPVRMVVPGLYGYVSATKWLTELELTRFSDYSAYWVPRGWSARAPIKTESRIDTPRDGSRPRAGRVTVAGVAWAQHRGISGVEVRVDDGGWHQATLGAVPSVDTWRLWSWDWADATPGQHTLTVRATDNAGTTQTEVSAPPDPNGASGWHTVTVRVG